MNKVDEKKVIKYLDDFIKHNTPGVRLPAEPVIAKELGVPTNIVRSILFYYRQKGLIRTKRGAGSYIAKFKQDKYIVFMLAENMLTGIESSGKDTIYHKIYELTAQLGFTPYVCKENETNKIKDVPLSQIAGVISFFILKTDFDYYKKNNIPVINISDIAPSCYVIYLNYQELFRTIRDLFKKHNIQNPLFFTMIFNISDNNNIYSNRSFIVNAMGRYFENKYRLKYVQAKTNMKNAITIIRDSFSHLNFTPDALVFLDDVIFKGAIDVINNDDKFKNIKIITYSNEDMDFPKNVCRITFDPQVIAEETVELFLKLFRREYITDPIVYINSKIINEEALL